MGALHRGHTVLVEAALARAGRVVATIFLNPAQFGPNEDLATYPRREAEDQRLLDTAGAHLLFAPSVEEMYPEGFATAVTVAGLSEGLCGAHRPAHFIGVATVVTKLLVQAMPDVALFGEKDYQQLVVIKRLARDLDLPIEILGVPTVREPDGLALSSRNVNLSAAERRVAPRLHEVLSAVAGRLETGADPRHEMSRGLAALAAAGFAKVDYLEVRAADSLEPLDRLDRPARVLAAAWLGRTRLIDNVPAVPRR